MNEPLTYRNEYPTEPGWYWEFSMIDGLEVIKYFHREDCVRKPLAVEFYLYAGPIATPERSE